MIAQEKLAEVVQARLEEILSFVKERLQSSKFDQMIPAGIVLTGGVTQTEGFLKLAEDVFEHNCRIGAPDIVASLGGAGNSPAWSVGRRAPERSGSHRAERPAFRGKRSEASEEGLFLDHQALVYRKLLSNKPREWGKIY